MLGLKPSRKSGVTGGLGSFITCFPTVETVGFLMSSHNVWDWMVVGSDWDQWSVVGGRLSVEVKRPTLRLRSGQAPAKMRTDGAHPPQDCLLLGESRRVGHLWSFKTLSIRLGEIQKTHTSKGGLCGAPG